MTKPNDPINPPRPPSPQRGPNSDPTQHDRFGPGSVPNPDSAARPTPPHIPPNDPRLQDPHAPAVNPARPRTTLPENQPQDGREKADVLAGMASDQPRKDSATAAGEANPVLTPVQQLQRDLEARAQTLFDGASAPEIERARSMFEFYRLATNNRSPYTGDELPAFDSLSKADRLGWLAASLSISMHPTDARVRILKV